MRTIRRRLREHPWAVLPYGIINWATKGVFLGERHLYFTPQPDDMLSFGDRWDHRHTHYRL